MDNLSLKKKLSCFISDKGQIRGVTDDLLYEVLVAWENWTGKSSDFYRSLGFTYRQMAGLIGKAKKLRREGYFGEGEFKQIKIEEPALESAAHGPCAAIEIVWKDGHVIRFSRVDVALEFIKKAS